MMECWNSGIMGSGIMQCWVDGKICFNGKIKKGYLPFNPPQADQYTTIPLFHGRGQNAGLKKYPIFSLSYRNSEMFN
jgi:hypothetical protein